jgi:hypothetical protein
MEAAFNVLMVVLGMGFAGGIVFTVIRARSGKSIMPDFRIPTSTVSRHSSRLSHQAH